MAKMSMLRDINGYVTFGLPFADTPQCLGVVVQAADMADKTITVPGNSTSTIWEAVFSFEPGTSVWVANNKSVVIPAAGDPTAVECAEQNPGSRLVKTGDVLHFATADTSAVVQVGFYGRN